MKNCGFIIKRWYEKLSYKKISAYLFIIVIIGHVFNTFWGHKHFYINQYLLLFMLIIQIFVLKKIDLENKTLEQYLKERKEMEVWGSFNSKIRKCIAPMWNIILSLFFVLIYIVTMFKVGCLEYTPTGIYGGILGAFVFFVGIQTYIKYLALLYFAYDLKRVNINHYFFYIPALTDWIVRLAYEFSFIEKWFLILGLMYSTMYAINIPANDIIFNNDNVISIETSSNFLFIITWIGIIIFFALAVPAFTFLSRYFIKECICKCKGISIKNIERQIKVLSNNASEKDLNIIQTKLSLIKEISMSEEYPLKYQHTVFDSFYTISLALLTLVGPFMSIIEQFIFKG